MASRSDVLPLPADGGYCCVDSPQFNARLVRLLQCVDKALIVGHVAQHPTDESEWVPMSMEDWRYLISWRSDATIKKRLADLVDSFFLETETRKDATHLASVQLWRLGPAGKYVRKILEMRTAPEGRRW
jgi:hypothetical protein